MGPQLARQPPLIYTHTRMRIITMLTGTGKDRGTQLLLLQPVIDSLQLARLSALRQ